MPLYRVLEPLSYVDGDRVINVVQIGAIIPLSTAQAGTVPGKVEYVGSGSDPTLAPRATFVVYDSLAMFPETGSGFHIYLDQSTGELYRWFEGAYQALLGILTGTVPWDNVTSKPDVIAYGDTQQEARDAIGAVGTGDLSDVATSGDYTDLANIPAEFTPEAHSHDVDDINATGTPSGTTYLRGDGTWSTPAGAGTMNDVVDDTSPTLGGNLDVATYTVGDASAADLTKLSNVTASDAELNILDGATLSTTELNYLDGVTSGVQTQLDAKPDTGDIPTALADLDTTVTGSELDDIATKLDGIEAGADVTDSVNVESAGAVMTSAIVDEDDMVSDSDTLIPTQQSVKAYVDAVASDSFQLTATSEKTGNYTASSHDWVIVNATGNLTITMPASPMDNDLIGIYIRGGASDVSLAANSGQELFRDGSGTTSLALQGSGGTIGLSLWKYESTGAFWMPVSYTTVPASTDIVDSTTAGRNVLTAADIPAIQDYLNIVSGSDAVGNRTWELWVGTETEYGSIAVKSDSTIYLRTA